METPKKPIPKRKCITPCSIKLEQMDLTILAKNRTKTTSSEKIMDPPTTPKANIEFSQELKKIINERNILTTKTRKQVFQALDEIKSKSEEESRNFKREKSLLEIINSEIKYVHQLEIIINFFMKPAREQKLLRDDDFRVLFGNIVTIYNVNKELLEELNKGVNNITSAFSKIGPYLKLYSVYAYEFKNILHILQLELDMLNWMEYKLIGSRIYMRKGVIPHKFINSPKPSEVSSKSQLSPTTRKRRSQSLEKLGDKVKRKFSFDRLSSAETSTIVSCEHSPEDCFTMKQIDSPSGTFLVNKVPMSHYFEQSSSGERDTDTQITYYELEPTSISKTYCDKQIQVNLKPKRRSICVGTSICVRSCSTNTILIHRNQNSLFQNSH